MANFRQKNSKIKRKFKDLQFYRDPVTNQYKQLFQWWHLIIFLATVLVVYLSVYQTDLVIRLFGESLNYLMPVFYIFLIISYFILILFNQF